MARYTEELYKKDPHDSDNHDGVIIHLEPDILECEVKWGLRSITTNKTSGGDEIPVELDYAVKCSTQHASKIGKLSSGHSTGKGQFSFQSQGKAMNVQCNDNAKAFCKGNAKNVQTITQLHSSHMLAK